MLYFLLRNALSLVSQAPEYFTESNKFSCSKVINLDLIVCFIPTFPQVSVKAKCKESPSHRRMSSGLHSMRNH